MLNAEELRFILDQLREVTIVPPSDLFPYRITAQQIGYSHDLFVAGLQAKLSIMLEAASKPRPKSPAVPSMAERLRTIVEDAIEHEGVALTCEVVEEFNSQHPYEPLSVEEANRQLEEMGYVFRDGADSCGAWVRP